MQSGHQASHKTACRRDKLRTVAHDLFKTVSQYRAQLLCHALEASGFERIRKAIELLRAILHHIPERSLELFVDLDPGILRCGSERGQVSLQIIQLRVPHRFQCAVRVLQLLRESFPLGHAFFVRGVEAHHQVVQSIHVRLAADGRESRVPFLFRTPCQGCVQLRQGFMQSDEVAFRVECRHAQLLHHLSGLPGACGQVCHDRVQSGSCF